MDPDPTPFFSDFKDAKKYFISIFSYNLPAGILSSVIAKILFVAKILCLNPILQTLLQTAQPFMRKGKDPDPDPHLSKTDLDPGGGGP
jgi:hypothetical protein